jgi:osmotically inducible lipoprotein OsmB
MRSVRVTTVASIALCTLALGGCSNMNQTEQRLLSGGAIGAGVGAGATLLTGGCVTCGAVIGGAIGAGAGYVIDQVDKDKK